MVIQFFFRLPLPVGKSLYINKKLAKVFIRSNLHQFPVAQRIRIQQILKKYRIRGVCVLYELSEALYLIKSMKKYKDGFDLDGWYVDLKDDNYSEYGPISIGKIQRFNGFWGEIIRSG